jgi:hypothetical protein
VEGIVGAGFAVSPAVQDQQNGRAFAIFHLWDTALQGVAEKDAMVLARGRKNYLAWSH